MIKREHVRGGVPSGSAVVGHFPIIYYHCLRILAYQRNTFCTTYALVAPSSLLEPQEVVEWLEVARIHMATRVAFLDAILDAALAEINAVVRRKGARARPQNDMRIAVLDAWLAEVYRKHDHGLGSWGTREELSALGDPLIFGEWSICRCRVIFADYGTYLPSPWLFSPLVFGFRLGGLGLWASEQALQERRQRPAYGPAVEYGPGVASREIRDHPLVQRECEGGGRDRPQSHA